MIHTRHKRVARDMSEAVVCSRTASTGSSKMSPKLGEDCASLDLPRNQTRIQNSLGEISSSTQNTHKSQDLSGGYNLRRRRNPKTPARRGHLSDQETASSCVSDRSSSEEERQEAYDYGSQICEYIHCNPTIQARNDNHGHQAIETHGSNDQNRSQGWILSHSHSQKPSDILGVSMERNVFQIQGSPVRSIDSSLLVHQVPPPNSSISQNKRVSHGIICGRFSVPSQRQEYRDQDKGDTENLSSFWIIDQSREVIPFTLHSNGIPRVNTGLSINDNSSSQEEDKRPQEHGETTLEKTQLPTSRIQEDLGEIHGFSNCPNSSHLTNSHHAIPIPQNNEENSVLGLVNHPTHQPTIRSQLVDKVHERLERKNDPRQIQSATHPNNRRIGIWLGCNIPEQESGRILELEVEKEILKPEGTSSRLNGPKNVRFRTKRLFSESSVGQQHGRRPNKPLFRKIKRVKQNPKEDFEFITLSQHQSHCRVSTWSAEHSRGLTIEDNGPIRLDAQQINLSNPGQEVGTSHSRSFCYITEQSGTKVQCITLLPGSRGNRCNDSMLESRQQLGQSSVLNATRCDQSDTEAARHNHSDSSHLEVPTMVQTVAQTQTENCPSSQLETHVPSGIPGQCGTIEKPSMASCRIQDLWKRQALEQGWDEDTANLLSFSRSPNTERTYNSILAKCQRFCQQQEIPFPPQRTADLAKFLDVASRGTERPENAIKLCCAALLALDDKRIPLKDPLILRMKQALISTRTTRPQKSGSILEIEKILEFVRTQLENPSDKLQIRDKAILLTMLATMGRPIDMTIIRMDGVTQQNGFITVTLLGAKNDRNRMGISKIIRPASVAAICPVKALLNWLNFRIREHKARAFDPLFSHDNDKSPLTPTRISTIISRFFKKADVRGQAKDIRSTMASRAAKAGFSPLEILKIGGWKNWQTVLDH